MERKPKSGIRTVGVVFGRMFVAVGPEVTSDGTGSVYSRTMSITIIQSQWLKLNTLTPKPQTLNPEPPTPNTLAGCDGYLSPRQPDAEASGDMKKSGMMKSTSKTTLATRSQN